jgi:hypothetical protein
MKTLMTIALLLLAANTNHGQRPDENRANNPPAANQAPSLYQWSEGVDHVMLADVLMRGKAKNLVLPRPPKQVALTEGGVIKVAYDKEKNTLQLTAIEVGTTMLIVRTDQNQTISITYRVVATPNDETTFRKRYQEISERITTQE